jgi:transposase InsO family protein
MVYNGYWGDRLMDFAYKVRCMVFDEWLGGEVYVKDLCKKYGFSRKWFYKFKKRFLKQGYEGLKNKIRSKPVMPHALGYEKKIAIMDHVFEAPTHGPRRICMELREKGIMVSEGAIYNALLKENMNTRWRRRLWAESQGKPTLTKKEKLCMQARKNHIDSRSPGELVGFDTFTVNIKGLGKIWQYTACDTYSSYGWAKCYYAKTSDNAVDFLVHHVLKNVPAFKIKRILTDQGTEFYSARHRGMVDSYFTRICKRCGVKHSVTKVAHPWTNGYAERLNQTIWQEFYLCLLPRPYASIEALNNDLETFMKDYNFNRMHTGYKLKKEGFRFPGHAFFDVRENKNIIEIKY